MEYALRDVHVVEGTKAVKIVLILILMEYALRVPDDEEMATELAVLILILMEYALRVQESQIQMDLAVLSLNPYSNGICSKSIV